MLLEVQLAAVLDRPSSQLKMPNLCDLFALDELPEPPKAVRTSLRRFIERAKGEMAEITDGNAMKQFVNEIAEVEAERIPASLRDTLANLAARESRDGTPILKFLDTVASVEPTPFEIGVPKMRVQTGAAVAPPKASNRRSGDARATSKRTAEPKSAPTRAPVVRDVEKEAWIRQTVLERLSTTSETGLSEMVLLAGLRHRARTEYPKLMPHEITSVLNSMLKQGVVRKSAGRWSRG